MQRYSIDHHTGQLYPHSNGHIVLYSEAMAGIEIQEQRTNSLAGEVSRLYNQTLEKDKEIDLLKGELELSKQEVFTKDQVIAESKTVIEKLTDSYTGAIDVSKILMHMQIAEKQLSRLTAALNDNERAEKVAMEFFPSLVEAALHAINDYRADLKKEVL